MCEGIFLKFFRNWKLMKDMCSNTKYTFYFKKINFFVLHLFIYEVAAQMSFRSYWQIEFVLLYQFQIIYIIRLILCNYYYFIYIYNYLI